MHRPTLRLLLLAVLAVLVFVSGLAAVGCGSDDEDAAAPTTAATTEPAEEKLKVGLITDLGQLDDDGFNELAFRGLTRAEEELGIEGRVIESASAADYIPNMTSLARNGYDLIIGVGFAQGDAVGKAAQRFPDVNFAIIDVDQAFVPGKPANVQGLLFREEEVGYLVGYLAGLVEKRRSGADVISAVGGMKEPPVDRFIAGYGAGAKKAAPGVKLLLDYSQDWDDQAKCKELALNQIARGSGIVFQVAGGCGLGALNAAGERKRWGIGVDADQSHLGDHILTSAQKGVDAAVFLTIESLLAGEFKGGGNATFGLKEDGVGLGKVSPKVPQEDVEQVEQIEQQIADGEIADIPTEVKG
jgi:basic membrane protein A